MIEAQRLMNILRRLINLSKNIDILLRFGGTIAQLSRLSWLKLGQVESSIPSHPTCKVTILHQDKTSEDNYHKVIKMCQS
jgi:hypothetical protein